ncbi:TPA: conjugal transfer protein TraG, partial [Klebsiella pneumoniae]
SNYTQEFVEYAQQNDPDATRILTDVSDPAVREKREALAGRFVEERLMPQLVQEFAANRAQTSDNMGSVAPGGGQQGVSRSDFDDQQQHMAQTAADHGVKAEGAVAGDVSLSRAEVQRSVDSAQEKVNKQQG